MTGEKIKTILLIIAMALILVFPYGTKAIASNMQGINNIDIGPLNAQSTYVFVVGYEGNSSSNMNVTVRCKENPEIRASLNDKSAEHYLVTSARALQSTVNADYYFRIFYITAKENYNTELIVNYPQAYFIASLNTDANGNVINVGNILGVNQIDWQTAKEIADAIVNNDAQAFDPYTPVLKEIDPVKMAVLIGIGFLLVVTVVVFIIMLQNRKMIKRRKMEEAVTRRRQKMEASQKNAQDEYIKERDYTVMSIDYSDRDFWESQKENNDSIQQEPPVEQEDTTFKVHQSDVENNEIEQKKKESSKTANPVSEQENLNTKKPKKTDNKQEMKIDLGKIGNIPDNSYRGKGMNATSGTIDLSKLKR